MSATDEESTDLAELTRSVDRLSDQAVVLRAQLRARTLALWTAITVGGLVLAVVVGAAYQVSLNNRAALASNNLRWCPVVEPLAPRAGDPPPAGTPEQVQRALRIRTAFTKLAHEFGCN